MELSPMSNTTLQTAFQTFSGQQSTGGKQITPASDTTQSACSSGVCPSIHLPPDPELARGGLKLGPHTCGRTRVTL